VAETYDCNFAVLVVKSSNGEPVDDESFTFNTQTFSKMSNLVNEFFKFVAAMQKIK
jgi:hypothetical protein